eukprot:SAG31_NODE_284_length_18497_cov_11.811773_13_plen_61_part_00
MPPTSAPPTGKDNESDVTIQTQKVAHRSTCVHTGEAPVSAVKHGVIKRGFVLVKVTGPLG